MFRSGIGRASPSNSLSTPAMIFSSVDLPEPLRPNTPILAPGKNESEMFFRISRFGGTTLLSRCMVKRSEEHTSELQSLMRISYAVFCLKKKYHTYFIQSYIVHFF